jgi:decaprenylphospho-beta-D-erythro-pentofuranosid-2-ulose 2-reductase
MARKVLMLGATSAIAQETAKLIAGDGDELFLVGRSTERLAIVARDLEVRSGGAVGALATDLNDVGRHAAVVDEASRALDGLDTVIIAHGILGDQRRCEESYADAELVLRTNLLSAVSLLTLVAQRFEAQGGGTIVAISSVAGDRGRRSNYVYGASKGGLSLFLQGLRNRLHGRGVRVVTIKPGFVDTPMTAHLDKGALFARPAAIARGIHRAMRRGSDVVYLPWFWRIIMFVIRLIPEPIFKRMRI